jgi:ferredoxin-NADP reductase
LALNVADWPGHTAGQHADVRLTAPDGYQARRTYSIASAREDAPQVALTVERIEGDEVSPYLVDELAPGDQLELRGPLGGYFIWSAGVGGPLQLVAGGSGICPLMAMLRHRAGQASTIPTLLVYSARSLDDVIFCEELEALAGRGDGFEVFYTLTRSQPAGWTGFSRRIDREMLATVAFAPSLQPLCIVCGPTPLVEAVAETLVDDGHVLGASRRSDSGQREGSHGRCRTETRWQRRCWRFAGGVCLRSDWCNRAVCLMRSHCRDRRAAPVHAATVARRGSSVSEL